MIGPAAMAQAHTACMRVGICVNTVADNPVAAGDARVPDRAAMSPRRVILPRALAQFICSFAGSNMNVMITDISDDLDNRA